jgi:hypothetical protein
MEREEAAMRTGTCILTALVLATSLDAQEPSSPAPRATPLVGNQAPAPEPPLIDNLPMEGGGMVTILPGGEPAAVEPFQAQPDPNTGNWLYMGEPGVTDAYAPPSAVVASPGDVPKAAPTPQPPR